MKKLTLKTVRISLKIAIIVSVIIGVLFQNFSGLLVSKGIVSFLYYTTQSNIILAITLGLLLYYEFKDLVPPKWLRTFHHINPTNQRLFQTRQYCFQLFFEHRSF